MKSYSKMKTLKDVKSKVFNKVDDSTKSLIEAKFENFNIENYLDNREKERASKFNFMKFNDAMSTRSSKSKQIVDAISEKEFKSPKKELKDNHENDHKVDKTIINSIKKVIKSEIQDNYEKEKLLKIECDNPECYNNKNNIISNSNNLVKSKVITKEMRSLFMKDKLHYMSCNYYKENICLKNEIISLKKLLNDQNSISHNLLNRVESKNDLLKNYMDQNKNLSKKIKHLGEENLKKENSINNFQKKINTFNTLSVRSQSSLISSRTKFISNKEDHNDYTSDTIVKDEKKYSNFYDLNDKISKDSHRSKQIIKSLTNTLNYENLNTNKKTHTKIKFNQNNLNLNQISKENSSNYYKYNNLNNLKILDLIIQNSKNSSENKKNETEIKKLIKNENIKRSKSMSERRSSLVLILKNKVYVKSKSFNLKQLEKNVDLTNEFNLKFSNMIKLNLYGQSNIKKKFTIPIKLLNLDKINSPHQQTAKRSVISNNLKSNSITSKKDYNSNILSMSKSKEENKKNESSSISSNFNTSPNNKHHLDSNYNHYAEIYNDEFENSNKKDKFASRVSNFDSIFSSTRNSIVKFNIADQYSKRNEINHYKNIENTSTMFQARKYKYKRLENSSLLYLSHNALLKLAKQNSLYILSKKVKSEEINLFKHIKSMNSKEFNNFSDSISLLVESYKSSLISVSMIKELVYSSALLYSSNIIEDSFKYAISTAKNMFRVKNAVIYLSTYSSIQGSYITCIKVKNKKVQYSEFKLENSILNEVFNTKKVVTININNKDKLSEEDLSILEFENSSMYFPIFMSRTQEIKDAKYIGALQIIGKNKFNSDDEIIGLSFSEIISSVFQNNIDFDEKNIIITQMKNLFEMSNELSFLNSYNRNSNNNKANYLYRISEIINKYMKIVFGWKKSQVYFVLDENLNFIVNENTNNIEELNRSKFRFNLNKNIKFHKFDEFKILTKQIDSTSICGQTYLYKTSKIILNLEDVSGINSEIDFNENNFISIGLKDLNGNIFAVCQTCIFKQQFIREENMFKNKSLSEEFEFLVDIFSNLVNKYIY